jgi:hypothetical protein
MVFGALVTAGCVVLPGSLLAAERGANQSSPTLRTVGGEPSPGRPDAGHAARQGPSGRPKGPLPPRKGPPEAAIRIAHDPPQSEPKQLEADAAQSDGKIYSLLGVNRGPLAFSRESNRPPDDLSASYRRFGIDIVRTHDFYGPSDWYVIFPKWTADAADPASYDFASSDARIKPIIENGFQCFYRLGTSWKGDRAEPINDPPGTLRGPDGQVTHRADRADFRKWAAICVQTVRHYTQGWNNGFHWPIEYWEIWNAGSVCLLLIEPRSIP